MAVRCVHEGCITLLSRDTISHGWDLCSTHREAARSQAVDSSAQEYRAVREGVDEKRIVPAAPTLAAIDAAAARAGMTPWTLLRTRCGPHAPDRYRKWRSQGTARLSTARSILEAIGVDPEVAIAPDDLQALVDVMLQRSLERRNAKEQRRRERRAYARAANMVDATVVLAAVEEAAQQAGLTPWAHIQRVTGSRRLVERARYWRRSGVARPDSARELLEAIGIDPAEVIPEMAKAA